MLRIRQKKASGDLRDPDLHQDKIFYFTSGKQVPENTVCDLKCFPAD